MGEFPETEVVVRYVWLDEDDNEVSPRHEKFKSALAFISGWHARYERLMRRWESYEVMPAVMKLSLTKTGKPPVRLTRLIVTYEYAALDDLERTTLQAFWQTSAAINA